MIHHSLIKVDQIWQDKHGTRWRIITIDEQRAFIKSTAGRASLLVKLSTLNRHYLRIC